MIKERLLTPLSRPLSRSFIADLYPFIADPFIALTKMVADPISP